MSRFDCPLFEKLWVYLESPEDPDYSFDSITPGKLSFIQSQFPVVRPKPAIALDPSDLACLYGRTWINDQVLNSYISLMASESTLNIGYTNSFFYKKLERDGCEAAAPWHGIKELPISRFDKFLVPVCCGVHWILVVFNFVGQQLEVLDSLNSRYETITDQLNDFLMFQGEEPLPVAYPRVPRQMNGDDCGVFVMEFAHCLFAGSGLNSFSQRDIPRLRREIRELLEDVMNS
jgi:Ulp1 family protease